MRQIWIKRLIMGKAGLIIALSLGCIGVWGLTSSALAESAAKKKTPTAVSSNGQDSSSDALQKQITDIDGQIQKLREQSLELQEKTRAKLQQQLEIMRKQRDTLIPRIEKLRDNSENAWQDIKENIQKAIEDLKTSVDSMEN